MKRPAGRLEELMDPADDRLIGAHAGVIALGQQLVTAHRGKDAGILAVHGHIVLRAGPQLPLAQQGHRARDAR